MQPPEWFEDACRVLLLESLPVIGYRQAPGPLLVRLDSDCRRLISSVLERVADQILKDHHHLRPVGMHLCQFICGHCRATMLDVMLQLWESDVEGIFESYERALLRSVSDQSRKEYRASAQTLKVADGELQRTYVLLA